MVGFDKYSDKLKSTDYAFAGALSGFITRGICQPLDVVKIRFQLQVEPIKKTPHSKYHSVPHAFYEIWREEGWRSFWKGHVPAQMLSIVYGLTQFWVFELLTKQDIVKNNHAYYMSFLCGSIAGTSATVMSFPFDVLRTRLVAQNENYRVYRGVAHAASKIYKTEPLITFYRGMLPTIVQVAPHAGIQFMMYNIFDNVYRIFFKLDEKSYSFTNSAISGSLAGLCAKTVVYPFDLFRKRLQVHHFQSLRKGFGKPFSCRRLTDCLFKTMENEGFKGLFKGLNPSLIKALVGSGLHFTTYELVLKILAEIK